MIQEFGQKIKGILEKNWDTAFIIAIMFLVALASFGLGRVSVMHEVVSLEATAVEAVSEEIMEPALLPIAQTGQYVASRSGTKYHFPWCSGAQNIRESNKIYFDSKEAAEDAGYAPAQNCKGL